VNLETLSLRASGLNQLERSRGTPSNQRATAGISGDAGDVADVAWRSAGTAGVRGRLIAAQLDLSKGPTLEPSKEATSEPTRERISAAINAPIGGGVLTAVARASSVRLRRHDQDEIMTTDHLPDINQLSCLANPSPSISGRRRARLRRERVRRSYPRNRQSRRIFPRTSPCSLRQ